MDDEKDFQPYLSGDYSPHNVPNFRPDGIISNPGPLPNLPVPNDAKVTGIIINQDTPASELVSFVFNWLKEQEE